MPRSRTTTRTGTATRQALAINPTLNTAALQSVFEADTIQAELGLDAAEPPSAPSRHRAGGSRTNPTPRSMKFLDNLQNRALPVTATVGGMAAASIVNTTAQQFMPAAIPEPLRAISKYALPIIIGTFCVAQDNDVVQALGEGMYFYAAGTGFKDILGRFGAQQVADRIPIEGAQPQAYLPPAPAAPMMEQIGADYVEPAGSHTPVFG